MAPPRAEWHVFAERQKISRKLPGIQGFGLAKLVPPAQLAQHIQEIRSKGFPDYRIKPEGDRETYSAIIYLEPFADRNLRAFGYDMLSEPVSRAAMERARDLDEVALSGKKSSRARACRGRRRRLQSCIADASPHFPRHFSSRPVRRFDFRGFFFPSPMVCRIFLPLSRSLSSVGRASP